MIKTTNIQILRWQEGKEGRNKRNLNYPLSTYFTNYIVHTIASQLNYGTAEN